MLETTQQCRSPVPIDTDTHAECLHFVRSAIAEADHTTAHQIAAVLKEVCQNGYADRTQIWADLTPIERQQFQSLLAPPPYARDDRQQNL